MKITHTALNTTHTFEIVDTIPNNYTIWNIGTNAPEGYIPLCEVIPNTYDINPNTLKCIKSNQASLIMKAINYLTGNIFKKQKASAYKILKKPNKYGYKYVKEAIQYIEALPIE